MSSASPGPDRRKTRAKAQTPPTSSEDDSSDFTSSTEYDTTSDDSESDTPPPPKAQPKIEPKAVPKMVHEARTTSPALKRPSPPQRRQPRLVENMDYNQDNSHLGQNTTPASSRAASKAPFASRKAIDESDSDSETADEVEDAKTRGDITRGSQLRSTSNARSTTQLTPPGSSDEDEAGPRYPPNTSRNAKRQSTKSTTSRQPRSRTRNENRPPDSIRDLSGSTLRDRTQSRRRSNPTNPDDPEQGAFDPKDTSRDTTSYGDNDCCGGGGCGCCSGCVECWRSIVKWRIWSWLRQKSAFIIGFSTCLGMIVAGGTGLMDWWVFASRGGYDLGGIGYCQGGSCTIQPVYDIEIGTSNIFLNTQILSVLLLLLSLVGSVFALLFIFMALSSTCNETFTPPHTFFLCCFFNDPPQAATEREIRRAGADNGFDPDTWGEQKKEDQREMLGHVRVKDYFQMLMLWGVWPCGIVLVGLLWAWVELSKAEEKLGFQAVVWGGATMFILYVLSVNVYRPTSHRASRQRISEGWDQASKRTRELRLKARQAKNTTMDAGKRGVQRAKEMRHEMTPQGRAEARRRRE